MQPLISPEDLQPLVGSPQLVVLDVRWRLLGPPGREDYAAGHVPGAVSSTWTPASRHLPTSTAGILSPWLGTASG